jgi:pyrimidine deaminase RibD-like protein
VNRWQHAMREALAEAALASAHGDVPIGALLVDADGVVVARAHNERELTNDPTAHAEVLALRRASAATGSWRLDGHTLVVIPSLRSRASSEQRDSASRNEGSHRLHGRVVRSFASSG